MNKKQKGFTLVELMIVVAIIGILAAIAIPKFAQMLEKSREGATKGNISAIKSAISIYYGDNQGVWPDDLTERNTATQLSLLSFITNYMDDLPKVKVTGAATENGVLVPNQKPNFEGAREYYPAPDPAAQDGGWTTGADFGHAWAYSPITGKIWVNSTLVDMKTTSYTIYGYE